MGMRDLVIPAEAVAAVQNPDYRVITVCAGTGCTSSASAEVRDALRPGARKPWAGRPCGGPAHRLLRLLCDGPHHGGQPRRDLLHAGGPRRRSGDRCRTHRQRAGGEAAAVPGPRAQDSRREVEPDRSSTASRSASSSSNCGLIDPENIDDYLAPRRLPGAGHGSEPLTPEEVIDDVMRLRAARARRRRLLHRHQVGVWRARPSAGPSTSSATPTKAIPARSWIARCWRATRTALIEGMIIAGYAIGAEAGLHLLPRRVPAGDPAAGDRARSRRASWACWARTSWAAISASTSQSRKAPAPSSAARRPR